ncbi:MAG: hypothetical protein IKD76_03925 [Clostridia bacterium]|nr:hypothetical protein [Clostridia bacterium]
MQREITVNEFANEVNSLDEINEPIIVKRNNKQDLVVISLEQYRKQLFLTKLSSKIEKSKQEVAQGKVHSARTVFKELRAKYGY